MTATTTARIKSYATDKQKSESLLALMKYWQKDSPDKISEEMALEFLCKLESGELQCKNIVKSM